MVLDGVALNRKLVSKFLTTQGFLVREADSVASVKACLASPVEGIHVDVLVTGLEHGAQCAWEMVQLFKRFKPNLKVVALTSDTRTETIREIYESGADGYLSKPFQPEQLRELLKRLSSTALDFRAACRMLDGYSNFILPVFMLDEQQRLIYGNRAFVEMFGVSEEQVGQRLSCCEVLGMSDCRRGHCVSRAAAQAGQLFQVEEVTVTLERDGHRLDASYVPLVDLEGEFVGHLVSCAHHASVSRDGQQEWNSLYQREKQKSLQLEEVMSYLEKTKDTLEKRVEERTWALNESRKELREVVDNIDLALMAFDNKGNIAGGYSRACEHLFGQAVMARRKNVFEVLPFADHETRESFEAWVLMAFKVAQRLPWAKIAQLCPLSDWKGLRRHFSSRVFPIFEDGVLQRILMMTRDKTEEVELQKAKAEADHRRMTESETLTLMMECSDESLKLFLSEVQSRHATLKSLINKGLRQEASVLALRCAHTIKGSASLLDLREISSLAHDLESALVHWKEQGYHGKSLLAVERSFEKLSACCLRLLNWGKKLKLFTSLGRSEREIRLGADAVEELLTWVAERRLHETDEVWLRNFGVMYQKLTFACGELFHRFEKIVAQVSLEREKMVNLSCSGGLDLRLKVEFWEKWLDPMNHLLRNAISHGVEDPDERLSKGKPREGQLTVSFAMERDRFVLSLRDDGRGVDRDKLYGKWLQENPEAQVLSEDEKLMLVFEAGLSTSKHVDEVSGRGVGMDIVKTMVESLGGEISIESRLGEGTAFVLKAPYVDPVLSVMGKG